MANLIFIALCLLSISSLPGGDTANLSLQRRPLDVRPRRTVHGEQRSAGNHVRMTRSVLPARVVDEHGNTVHLRPTGHASSRRVVNPFVTSHSRVTSYGRRQQTRTSGGRRLNYGKPEARTQVVSPATTSPAMKTGFQLSRAAVLRQTLPGSRGFATYHGERFDIRPHQGVVPHASQQTQTNRQGRYTATANQRSRETVPTNHRSRQPVSANRGPRRTLSGGRSFDRARHVVASYNSVTNKPTQHQAQTQYVSRPNPRQSSLVNTRQISQSGFQPDLRSNVIYPHNSVPRTISQHGTYDSPDIQQSSRNNGNFRHSSQQNDFRKNSHNSGNFQQRLHNNALGSPSSASLPGPETGISAYSHGLAPHTPLNARAMPTFLIQRSQQPRHYLDRTKDTGTLFTSHPGQCPVMPQSQCSPLPDQPLPPSCSNDYQCNGEQSKCCYDPCLTISRCVQPVFS